MNAAARQPNFTLLIIATWLLVAFSLLLQYWPETGITLNDTDDAMRLVEVRQFLAGHGWFDLHMARVQPPLGYDPHWSRLIDAGLAGLYLLLHQFFDAALSERLMRAIWPMLWLLPALTATVVIAWRLAGREAALLVLLFAVIGLPAMQQFKPGRIDHHNMQIATALMVAAAVVWSDRRRLAAAAAGALTGLGFAIGFEAAPFIVLCGAAMVIRYALCGTNAREMRDYGLAAAASTAIAFLVSVGPDHWTHTTCDAIAINSTAAVVVGGLGVALVSLFGGALRMTRWLAVGAAGLAAVLVFVIIEPRCLGGPYAMVDPAVKPIWLAHVNEMQPLLSLLMQRPATALGIAVFPVVGVIAVAMLTRRNAMRSDFAFLVLAASHVLAAALMFEAVKAYSYAMWFAMPLVAALVLGLFAALRLRTLVTRFLAALLFTPTVLSAGLIGVANAAGLRAADAQGAAREVCFRTASYAPLAALKPGLVATDIDFGPFVLALTPHSILTAPYHRLSYGILAAHKIFSSPPDQARQAVAQAHLDYIATCGPPVPADRESPRREASLRGQLEAGHVPDWLAPVGGAPGQAFTVYRVHL